MPEKSIKDQFNGPEPFDVGDWVHAYIPPGYGAVLRGYGGLAKVMSFEREGAKCAYDIVFADPNIHIVSVPSDMIKHIPFTYREMIYIDIATQDGKSNEYDPSRCDLVFTFDAE